MSIRGNVVANLVGRLWASVMSFALVPVYVRFMGIEAYGLVGFFVSLLAVFSVLDMGLSTGINRELARLTATTPSKAEARTLIRTLEVIYWGVGGLIGCVVYALAPWLATEWLNLNGLSVVEATQAIRLMGFVAALRWPVPMYSGGLMGLQRQVVLNAVTSGISTLQGLGAVVVLWLVSPTIHAFFVWQVFMSGLQSAVLIGLLWRSVRGEPDASRPQFAFEALRSIFGFSAGITGITILSVVLTQLDKVLVSRMLPLAVFGYYALAGSIAGVLSMAATAMYAAMFPAFSQLVASGREPELRELYHKSCQMLSVVVVPMGVTLAMFAPELLAAYVGDVGPVDQAHTVLRLLAVGNMLLSLMLLPLAVQLAYGWTELSFYKNVFAVALFVPGLIYMVRHYGVVGAAIVWVALTLGYVLVEVPLMHSRLLKGEMWGWYVTDVGQPLLLSVAVLGAARALLPAGMSTLGELGAIGAAAGVATLGTALLLQATRALLHELGLYRSASFRV